MHRRTSFWLAFWLCQAGFPQELGPGTPDPRTYLAFFREVSARKLESDQILLNGEATTLKRLTIQEGIGLTDPQTQALIAAAAECESRIGPISEKARALTFEARLRSVQSEDASEWLAQRLSALGKESDAVVLDQ